MNTAIEEPVETPEERVVRISYEVLTKYLEAGYPTDESRQQADLALSTIFRLTR